MNRLIPARTEQSPFPPVETRFFRQRAARVLFLPWAAVVCAALCAHAGSTEAPNAWAFHTANSYWSSPVTEAPVDPNSDYYIQDWKSRHANHKLGLVGFTGTYGFQFYFGTEADPMWTVTNTLTGEQFRFRGPANMTPSPGDNELVCVDTTQDAGNGVLYGFGAIQAFPPWNPSNRTGFAAYSGVQYLKSNGVDGSLVYSDEKRNVAYRTGHRGLAVLCFGPIVSEVQALNVPHMLNLVIPATGKSPYVRRANHFFPYIGNEGDTSDIPEGARVRLKASVQPRIDAMLNPYARALAQAFLTYGAVIGDIGGSGTYTRLQTGGTSLADWAAMGITNTSLAEFTIDDFEFVELGWMPPGM